MTEEIRGRRSGGQVFDLFFERGKNGSQCGFLFVWLREGDHDQGDRSIIALQIACLITPSRVCR